MSKEMQEFLDGLGADENPFAEQSDPFIGEQTPVEEPNPSVDVQEVTAVIETPEEPVPFHKDPKIQRFVQKQVQSALDDFKKTITQSQPAGIPQTDDEVSDIYTRLIGNDTPEKEALVKEMTKLHQGQLAKAEERAYQRIVQEQERQSDEERQFTEFIENSLEELEETHGIDLTSNAPVARKARAEFLAVVERLSPKDENGNVTAYADFDAAFEMYQASVKKPTPSPTTVKAKDLAARSINNRSSDLPVDTTGGQGWDAVEKVFETLGNN